MTKKAVVTHKVKQGKPEEDIFFRKHLHLILLACVVIITFIIYTPALHNQFTNWDDGVYITTNPYITSLSASNLAYIFSHPVANNYHPLTILSLALNYKISGLSPFSYYLVNLLIHLLNILLVFWLIMIISGNNRMIALFTAALFAVHPMHVESVAWISERKDVLYAFFFLGGLISYLQYHDRKSRASYFLSFLLFLLSALSKPTAVVFPLILLVIDYFRQRKLTPVMLAEKLPFLIIAVWIGLQTIHSQTEMVLMNMEDYTTARKLLFGSYGIFMYLLKLFFPFRLSAFYPFPPTGQPLPVIFYLTPVFNAAIFGGIIYSLKSTRILVTGVLFFLVSIILTLQFIQVGHALIADRYTYLAYIGLLVAVGWLANKLSGNRKLFSVRITCLLFPAFFIFCASLTASRVPVWENSETLWKDVIKKFPGTDIAYNNLGLYYFNSNQYPLAEAGYTKAIAVNPGYFEAWFNRGGLMYKSGRPQQAIADFTKAIALNHDYSLSFLFRAYCWSALGKTDSAILDYDRVIRMNPSMAEPFCNRGYLYLQSGMYDKAIADFKSAVDRNGSDHVSWFNLGIAYGKWGKYPESIESLTKALQCKPDYYEALINRAMVEASAGKGEDALHDMSNAIAMEPANQLAYFNRAIYFLNNGKKDLACGDLQMAIKCGNNDAKAIYQKECAGKY
ncbi:MAG: tetratricopeptide repeat protein [Bacteroidota bacterium]